MNDFWNNISRYPKFFISSVTGLLLIILTPFRNLLKIEKFRLVTVVAFLVFVASTFFIITKMAGF